MEILFGLNMCSSYFRFNLILGNTVLLVISLFFNPIDAQSSEDIDLVKDVVRNQEMIKHLEQQIQQLQDEVSTNLLYGLIAVFISVGISSIILYAIHTKETSKETSQHHLQDLKDYAVNPLLEHFDTFSRTWPHKRIEIGCRENVVTEESLGYRHTRNGISDIGGDLVVPLLEDLLDNHYKKVNDMWKNICELASDHNKLLEKFHSLIQSKTNKLLENEFDEINRGESPASDSTIGQINESSKQNYVSVLAKMLLEGLSADDVGFNESQDKRSLSIGNSKIGFKQIVYTNKSIINQNKDKVLEITKKLIDDKEFESSKQILQNYTEFRKNIDSMNLALRKISKKTVLKKQY